jgi:hypothetical protein
MNWLGNLLLNPHITTWVIIIIGIIIYIIVILIYYIYLWLKNHD